MENLVQQFRNWIFPIKQNVLLTQMLEDIHVSFESVRSKNPNQIRHKISIWIAILFRSVFTSTKQSINVSFEIPMYYQ